MSSVQQLDPDQLSAMLREINQGLMVTFINADLIERASLDVRRSIVFYDESQTFCYAAAELPAPEVMQRLYEQTAIRFWSTGC